MLSAKWIPNSGPQKRYGLVVLIASCLFSTITVAVVLWDERQQRERRRVGVKERLKTIQQQQNMDEYERQRRLYEQYRETH